MSKEVTEVEGQWNWRSRRFPLPYEGLLELDLPKVRMVWCSLVLVLGRRIYENIRLFGKTLYGQFVENGEWIDLKWKLFFNKKINFWNCGKMLLGSARTDWAPDPLDGESQNPVSPPKWNTPNKRRTMPILVSTLHHYTPEFNMDTIWYNAWGFHMKYHVQTLIVHPRKLTWNQNIDAWERVSFSSVTCIRSYISIAFQSLKKFQTNSTKTRNTMVGKSWKTKMHFPQIIQIQGIFIEPPGFGVIFADTCSGSIRKSRFKALQIHPWDPRYTCETCNDSRYRCEDETSQHRCAAYVV